MNKYLLVLIVGLFLLASFVNAEETINKNQIIFFGEITKKEERDIGTKYYLYNIKTKSKQEVNSKFIKSVYNGMPRISIDQNVFAYLVKENQQEFLRLLDLKNDDLIFNQKIPSDSGELCLSKDTKYAVICVFSDEWDFNTSEIYTIDIKAKLINQVTKNNIPDYNPVISPNSESIIFLQQRNGKTTLEKYNFGTQKIEDLKVFLGTGYHLFQYLDDGELVMTRKEKGGIPFRYNLETGKMTDLNIDRISDISISPDEKQMVYLQYMGYDDPAWDLFISDIDGKNVQKIPRARNIDILAPQWVNGNSK